MVHSSLQARTSISTFSSTHISYQKQPAVALFPLNANPILIRHLVRRRPQLFPVANRIQPPPMAWMVVQQPQERICIGMEVCILPSAEHPRRAPMEAWKGTVMELSLLAGGWAGYWVLEPQASSRPFLLYVPVVWADVSSHMPGLSRIDDWFDFVSLGSITPGILDLLLKDAYIPPEESLRLGGMKSVLSPGSGDNVPMSRKRKVSMAKSAIVSYHYLSRAQADACVPYRGIRRSIVLMD